MKPSHHVQNFSCLCSSDQSLFARVLLCQDRRRTAEISPLYRLSQLILLALQAKLARSELESLNGDAYKCKELKQKSRKTRNSFCFKTRVNSFLKVTHKAEEQTFISKPRLTVVCSNLNVPNLENLCIEIRKPNSKPFLIATWYRPPCSSIDLVYFMNHFLNNQIPLVLNISFR